MGASTGGWAWARWARIVRDGLRSPPGQPDGQSQKHHVGEVGIQASWLAHVDEVATWARWRDQGGFVMGRVLAGSWDVESLAEEDCRRVWVAIHY